MNHSAISFAIDDGVRVRCYLGLFGSALSVLLVALPIAVILFHPYYKHSLRLSFNWMLIGACFFHFPVAFSRMVASAALLRGTMTQRICVVTGAVNGGGETAVIVMLLAFYWSFMVLRFATVRRALERCIPQEWQDYFGVFLAAFMAGALGISNAMIHTHSTGNIVPSTGTPFDFELGWCAAGTTPGQYFFSNGVSLFLMIAASVVCVVALRCTVCLGLAIAQPLSVCSHWPIFVRFFGIVIFTACYAAVNTIHSFHVQVENYLLSCTILALLWAPTLAFIFLFTEGVPQVGLYRIFFKLFPSRRHTTEESAPIVSRDTFGDYKVSDSTSSRINAPQQQPTTIEISDPKFARKLLDEARESALPSERSKLYPEVLYTFPKEYHSLVKGGGFTNMVCTLMGIERSHGVPMVAAEQEQFLGM